MPRAGRPAKLRGMPLITLQNVDFSVGGPLLLEHVDLVDRTRRAHRPDRPQRRRQVDPAQAAGRRNQARRRRGRALEGGRRIARLEQEVPAGARRRRVRRGRRGPGRTRARCWPNTTTSATPNTSTWTRWRDVQAQDRGRRTAGRSTSASTEVLERLGLDGDAAFARLSGGMKRRVLLARALVSRARPAAARRADQPPRHRRDRLAGRLPEGLAGRAGLRHPRPPLPARAGHAHRRDRPRPGHQLARRLRQLPAPPRGAPERRGAGERALRQAAGAGGSLDPPGHQGPPHPRRRPRAPARRRCATSAPRAASRPATCAWKLAQAEASGKKVIEAKRRVVRARRRSAGARFRRPRSCAATASA